MKWDELTDEQAKTLRRWFAHELEVKINGNDYKFNRNHELKFRYNAPIGSWVTFKFHELYYGSWAHDFGEIWNHLNKEKDGLG